MPLISKKDVAHLAQLARLKLSDAEADKLSGDLEEIVAYFKELESIDTSGVVPVAGGTDLTNVFREDEAGTSDDGGKGADQFPETEGGLLKVPNIF